jgi:hypothetical protein
MGGTQRGRFDDVSCDEPGCVLPALAAIGVGRRLLGWQRLEYVRLLCAEHSPPAKRRLCELQLRQWLAIDLTPFQHRWHRSGELDDFLRGRIDLDDDRLR